MNLLMARAIRRPILAIVLAAVLAPAFAGYAAGVCAGGDTGMPCCRPGDAVAARLAAGCCRVQQDQAPVQPAINVISTARVVSFAAVADVPVTTVPRPHDSSSTFTASPPGRCSPLYVRLSALRR